MSEICSVAMANLVERTRRHGDDYEDVTSEVAREGGVGEGWDGCTPERLYLFLRLVKMLNGEAWWERLMQEKWNVGTKNVICDNRLGILIPILEVSKPL